MCDLWINLIAQEDRGIHPEETCIITNCPLNTTEIYRVQLAVDRKRYGIYHALFTHIRINKVLLLCHIRTFAVHIFCYPPACHVRLQVFIKVSHLNLTLLVDYVG